MTELLKPQTNYEKIRAYVGFAFNARKIVVGTDNILKTKNNGIVLLSDDLSQNAKNKIKNHAKNETMIFELKSDNFYYVTHKTNIKAIKIVMPDIEKAIINYLQENREE